MAIEDVTEIVPEVSRITPFQKLVLSIGEIPTNYLDSMTYSEQVTWFCMFLQEKVLPVVDQHSDKILEIINYLNNLDLQDEVNNKLDEMTESGELQEIIAAYLNANALWCFDNIEDMKSATNLIDGSYARTLGFYAINDGGEAIYKIKEHEEETINNKSIIELDNDLIAVYINTGIVYPEQFGAYGDNTNNDTDSLNLALSYKGKIILNKKYKVNNQIILHENSEISGNGTITLTGGIGAATASGYIHADDKSNISLCNITIDNQCNNQSNDKTITFKNCSNILVDNCKILNKGYRTGWTLVFWNCSYSKITNNYIKGSDSYQLDDGIHVTGHDLLIDGNYIETIDDSIAIGYNSISSTGGIQPTSSTVSKNINITNNNIKSTEAGIHLYTYSNETSIENVNINNINMDGRIIIRDDVSNETSITIKKVTISNCNINNVSHTGNSPLIAVGNCKEVLIDSCNLESIKGVGIIVAERVGNDALINNCNIKYTQENPQYRSIINFGNITANMSMTIQNCNIITNCRLTQGYFKELKIYNNYFENTQTDTTAYNVVSVSGLGDNGVEITHNRFKTNASSIVAVGSLTDKLFIFAFNTTNVANPTYEVGATNFHTNYNIIY